MVKIAISLGDPAGISPEILVKGSKKLPEASYIIYGSQKAIEKAKEITGQSFGYSLISSPEEANSKDFFLINIYDKDFQPGKPNIESGKAAVLFLENAVKDTLRKKVDALVTLPISKQYIMEAGFKFAGHTDYLAHVSGVKNYIMMLMCDELKVALATTHIPLKDVPKAIKKENLISKIKLLDKELKNKFRINSPKIAVLGLNPHAGDGGNIGTEEIEIIQLAIDTLRKEGFNVTGVLSADTAFNRRDEFDAYFAMYHDQGLIPLKLLCFKKAINITLGLPFIRTSPDHGTGFDIAGKNIADPSSFVEAVKLAYKLATINSLSRH
ncbi:4-hydroxythreonine-4-phosphate dehydrogenase PdxA [Persephonella sp. KM09-Lau-8]|uniref:4-hydroxythreonine-4-phosphate dehydrogenase PdxA n=1 Tax=Persephonella sp. KM09-Lau-8 TaxID=1158345 RepID=UPI0004984FE0|nr:4-hydroxythreonine-4-phosphate dehydrogenase PdxA [Persephonella sp. KM09-Lau-8]